MKKISDNYFTLEPHEFVWYTHGVLEGVPGIKPLFDPTTGKVLSVDLHRTHLPLLTELEGKWLDEQVCSPISAALSLPFKLRPYQQKAVEIARSRPTTGLFHDLGLGKTAIVLASMDYPAVGVCPTAAIKVWEDEAKRFGLTTQTLKGIKGSGSSILPGKDLYLVTYGSCAAWLPYFRRFGSGPRIYSKFADEAHALHLKKSNYSQAFNSLVAPQTLLATATPMRNRMKSLHGLLEGLAPGAFGYRAEFRERYAGAYTNELGYLVDGLPSNQQELADRLTEVIVYESWSNPTLQHIRPKNIRKQLDVKVPVAHICEALQVAIKKAFGTFRGQDGLGGIQMAYLTAQRTALGDAKVQAVTESEEMDKLMDRHPRIIWWVYHKEAARLMWECLKKKRRRPVDWVTGSTQEKTRNSILDEWEHGDSSEGRDLVATMSSLNSAVNLVTAQAAVVIEQSWAPIELQQLEARHHRPGNKYPEVYTYYFTVPNTIDSRISRALIEKIEDHESTFGASSQKAQMLMLLGHSPLEDEIGFLQSFQL